MSVKGSMRLWLSDQRSGNIVKEMERMRGTRFHKRDNGRIDTLS